MAKGRMRQLLITGAEWAEHGLSAFLLGGKKADVNFRQDRAHIPVPHPLYFSQSETTALSNPFPSFETDFEASR
jgi:hypothetical protein